MKKVFLALMAVAAIAFTGCKKEDPKPSQEELDKALVTAAKDALDTDGKALVEFLTKNGYTDMGSNEYKNGNEYCSFEETPLGLVRDIRIYKKHPNDFAAIKSHFLRMETACATVFPTGFEGESDLGEVIGAFDKELEFRNYAAQVTEGQFTKTWNRLRGRSDINDNSIRELVFEYSSDDGVWVSDLHIWKPEI